MSDAFIEVAPDSTGKKLQTFENTVSANDVHAEAVALVDQFGVPLVTIPVSGGLTNTELRAASVPVRLTSFVGDPLASNSGDILEVALMAIPTSGGNQQLACQDTGSLNVYIEQEIGLVADKGEDAASASGDAGVPAMAIRKATPANTSDLDGDYEMLQMDGGKLWVKGPLTDTELRATPVPVSGSFSLPTGAATEAKQDTQITDLGGVTETAPSTDTASSGLNGRLQRIAQRITSLIALFPTSIGQKTKATALGVTLASDEDDLTVQLGATASSQLDDIVLEIGATTATAPASDTATASLNGRLQRIAQRITSLIALLPASLGQKTKANSFAVTLASDSDTLPVSAASLPLPSGASTAAKQPALGTALAPSTDVLATQRPAVTQVVSTAFEASKVLKASAGQLVQLSIFNSGPAQFILLINSTTVPANGAVTLLYPPIPIAAATLLVLDLPAPLVASTGIAVCNSSTGTFTKTLGAADCAFYAQVN